MCFIQDPPELCDQYAQKQKFKVDLWNPGRPILYFDDEVVSILMVCLKAAFLSVYIFMCCVQAGCIFIRSSLIFKELQGTERISQSLAQEIFSWSEAKVK